MSTTRRLGITNLVVPCQSDDDIPDHLNSWWTCIFEYVNPDSIDRIQLRRFCRLFNKTLQSVPMGKYSMFPHPNHTSLKSLVDRLYELYQERSTKAPTLLFIQEGIHTVLYKDEYEEDELSLFTKYPKSKRRPLEDVNKLQICFYHF